MARKRAEHTEQETRVITETAFKALTVPYAQPQKDAVQLSLFEGYKAEQAKQKASSKWAFQDELLAQFLARGYSNVEAYRLAHPEVKTQNTNTLYPNASRACNRSNIQARVEQIKKELEEKALMSTTEYYTILTGIAREASKDRDRLGALKLIGQVKGLFQAEKGLPGSEGAPIVVRWESDPSDGESK